MKKSSDWVRKAGFYKMLDQLVEQRGITPAELIPYDAAKALDIEPSGDFYRKVRDWKQRHAAASGQPSMAVPPHILANFRETIDRFGDDAMIQFERAVGNIGGDIRRDAERRISDAEQRAEAVQGEVNGLIDHWANAEAERDAARSRVADLEQQLEELRRANERLRGRVEQREFDAREKERQPAPASDAFVDKPPPDFNTLAYTLAYTLANGPPDEDSGVEGDDARRSVQVADDIDGSTSAVAVERGQPPAIATSPAAGGWIAMPIVDNAAADQADGGADGHG